MQFINSGRTLYNLNHVISIDKSSTTDVYGDLKFSLVIQTMGNTTDNLSFDSEEQRDAAFDTIVEGVIQHDG